MYFISVFSVGNQISKGVYVYQILNEELYN